MYWGKEAHRKMKVRFLLEQYAFLKEPQPYVPYLPDALDVDISNRCNIKCISCFHSIEGFKPFKDMTLDTLQLVLDQAEGIASTITFGNHGETFIHREALTMIREVKERGFFLNIINNGTLMTPKRAQAVIDLGVDRVAFSLDSVDPEVYPKVRRGAKHNIVMRNILNFIRLNYEQGLKVYVNISAVNTRLALTSNPNIYDYFAKLPVHVVYTSDLLNFQDKLDIREETKFYQSYKDIKDPEQLPVCLNGFDRLLIRPNGNVSLCAIDVNSVHILGNVHDTHYVELWNNEKAQEFRRGIINKDYSLIEQNGKLCSKCDGKWAQDVTLCHERIVDILHEDVRHTKRILDEEIGKPERYDNLIREIERIEQLSAR